MGDAAPKAQGGNTEAESAIQRKDGENSWNERLYDGVHEEIQESRCDVAPSSSLVGSCHGHGDGFSTLSNSKLWVQVTGAFLLHYVLAILRSNPHICLLIDMSKHHTFLK